jgi:DNA modification methylase
VTRNAASATWRVICADVLEGLAQIPNESVQCVVTSPPYWGLRDYGTASWEGGDATCDHAGTPRPRNDTTNGNDGGHFALGTRGSQPAKQYVEPWREACGKCGARRIDQQIGLEPTPEAYVERLVEVFREIRRVLRPDGTVWLNLGDSYNSPGANNNGRNSTGLNSNPAADVDMKDIRTRRIQSLKPKDLVGIPWRVAFALQADGWWLRSDIIWAKPNPMPESVTDRPTKAHEYLFLLTKNARYFWDTDAVREPLDTWREVNGEMVNIAGGQGNRRHGAEVGRPAVERLTGNMAEGERISVNPAGRNLRSVWNIATEPFPEAHFATFPKALVVPCVKAGSRPGDTVLDPFAGSGTVGVVALRLGRSFVGIELSPEYAEMARRRIADDGPLFNVPAEVTA